MGIVIKQGLRNSIVTYIGVIIGAINLLYVFPKLLKPEEIGLSRVLIDISLILASFAQLGAGAITDKFFPFFRDETKKHKGFLPMLLLYPLVGFIILTAAFLFFKDLWIASYQTKSPLLINYFYHIIPLTFFIMYQQIMEAYCRAHYKIVVPGFVREIYLRLFMTIIVVLYFTEVISLNLMVMLLIISYSTAVLILLFYIKYLKKLYLDTLNFISDKGLQKEMLIFSLLVFFVGAFSYVATRVDVLFLSSINGLAYTGIYSIAFFIGTVIEIPRRSISQISSPLISTSWKNNDLNQIGILYKKSSLNQLIIGLFLFLMIWCNVDFILGILPNSEIYKAGKYVILFIGLSRLIDMGMGLNMEIIANSPYYKFNFILAVFSGVMVIFTNYFLIHKYGMNGAALSTFLNFGILNLIRFIYIKFKLNIQPFSKSSLTLLILGIVCYFVVSYIPDFGNSFFDLLLNIAIRSLVILLVFIGPVFYFKVSEDFNNIILKGLSSIGINK